MYVKATEGFEERNILLCEFESGTSNIQTNKLISKMILCVLQLQISQIDYLNLPITDCKDSGEFDEASCLDFNQMADCYDGDVVYLKIRHCTKSCGFCTAGMSFVHFMMVDYGISQL